MLKNDVARVIEDPENKFLSGIIFGEFLAWFYNIKSVREKLAKLILKKTWKTYNNNKM